MAVHSEFRKGQRILIIYRDGSQVALKYVEKKSGKIFVEYEDEIVGIPLKEIRAISIYRG